jgi:peptidoglycan/LPS O-acetylase OafA/YrhL
MRTTHTLTPSASFLLDVIRFSAAILVVIAHLGHPEIPTGFRNRQILGDIAVPVFFVLSGFVIRFVTLSREHTLREYTIDRAARIYSVALPAMILTVALSAFCFKLAPAYYLFNWGEVSNHALTRIVLNLIFLSQSWGHNTIPFLNTPFWSLSYECLFYAAYGLFSYLRGPTRIVAFVIWIAIAGPQVLFLLPTWLLGCLVYDLYESSSRARHISRVRVAAAILIFPFAWGSMKAIEDFSALRNPLTLLHLQPMRATMMALGTGTCAAAIMLLLLLVSDLIPAAPHNRWLRRFRHLADGTFAIYLMHYPLMVLGTTLGLYSPANRTVSVVTTILICLLLILAARPLDFLKSRVRAQLRRFVRRGTALEART